MSHQGKETSDEELQMLLSTGKSSDENLLGDINKKAMPRKDFRALDVESRQWMIYFNLKELQQWEIGHTCPDAENIRVIIREEIKNLPTPSPNPNPTPSPTPNPNPIPGPGPDIITPAKWYPPLGPRDIIDMSDVQPDQERNLPWNPIYGKEQNKPDNNPVPPNPVPPTPAPLQD